MKPTKFELHPTVPAMPAAKRKCKPEVDQVLYEFLEWNPIKGDPILFVDEVNKGVIPG